MRSGLRIAGAPISWGVCEAPGWGYQMDAERVLREAAELGLTAVEAGPDGFLPRDPAEAEQRFFTRYSEIIGGDSWDKVQSYLRSRAPKPTTVEGWIATAEAVRDRARNDSSPAMAA